MNMTDKNSAASDDLLVKTGELPWIPMMDGIAFKLLRVSGETGAWTVILQCQAGSAFPLHRHYGAGEYYVITGHMVYRAGEAVTGDYGYEPLDSIHQLTRFPQYTELLFTNHGPVAFLNEDDGSIAAILDHSRLVEMVAEA